jgi:hypothetical protein
MAGAAAVAVVAIAAFVLLQPGFHRAIGAAATESPRTSNSATSQPTISSQPSVPQRPATQLSSGDNRFYSQFMGYSAAVASPWSVKPATTLWAGFDVVASGDEIDVAGTDSTFWGASQPLVTGITFQAFLTDVYMNENYKSANPDCVPPPTSWNAFYMTTGTGAIHTRCDGTQEAFISVGDRVFGFAMSNRTTDPTQHAGPAQFGLILDQVRLAPPPTNGTSATSVPPLSVTLHSPTRGYSIDIPKGWKIRPDASLWDEIDGPGGAVIEVDTSVLPAGTDFDGYLRATYDGHVPIEPPANPAGTIATTADASTVAGRPGLMFSLDSTSSNGTEAEFLVVDGGRVYRFIFGNYYTDMDLSNAMLATIVLTPETAH